MKLPKHKSTYISLWVTALWIILIIVGFLYFFSQNLTLEMIIFWMQEYIRENLMIGILIFLWLYTIRPLFFITAIPFDIFSWMVFGPIIWFVVSSASTLLSIMFTYVMWYLTGWILLEKRNFKKLESLKLKLRTHTFKTAVSMRLIMLPFDLSNYICWVLQAPFLKFVFGTWIWVLPGTAVFVAAGTAFYGKNVTSFDTLIQNVNTWYLILSSAFFISIIILSKVVKEKYWDLSI